MAIKYIKKTLVTGLILGFLLVVTACPQDTFCFEQGRIPLPDKIVITPSKRLFSSGESLKITISIPSKINHGQNINDINDSLGVEKSNKFSNISNILKGNNYTVNKGRLDENKQLILQYSSTTDSYEFECEITLKRKGNYSQFGNNESLRFEKDLRDCEFIDIRTNIKGINQDGFYEFTVE